MYSTEPLSPSQEVLSQSKKRSLASSHVPLLVQVLVTDETDQGSGAVVPPNFSCAEFLISHEGIVYSSTAAERQRAEYGELVAVTPTDRADAADPQSSTVAVLGLPTYDRYLQFAMDRFQQNTQ